MNYDKAKNFIYKNARPFDLARWKYHFENGSKEDVLKELLKFQNPDGGFGHALEPDYFNPFSSPIQTWKAMNHLIELQINDKNHQIIKDILRYLGSDDGFDKNQNQWMFAIKSNNDYPHAIWWRYDENNKSLKYNPTAYISGFIIKYGNKDSELYQKALRLAVDAFNYIKNLDLSKDGDTLSCFVGLYRFLKETDELELIPLDEFKEILAKEIHDCICKDPSKYGKEYVTAPSRFFENKHSLFIEGNEGLIEKEMEILPSLQMDNGGFDICWKWYTEYDKEFEIARVLWQSDITIKNLLYYYAFKEKIK